MYFRYIIILLLIQFLFQTILSHREYHHNIKLRTLHKHNKEIINNNENNHLQNDSELNSSTNICGKLCFACFTLMILFYLFMAGYIFKYFWKKRFTTRKSREIRFGLNNELRMYSQFYNNNNNNNNNREKKGHNEGYNYEGDWMGKKNEPTICVNLNKEENGMV
ncbi:unnamed protein product [Rhizophagus irregularis]|nr:unnamed protein product [Rhizophagus irregularis]CAB5380912.1 unnamed protein product [Rhizophagus irregularis]